MRLTQKFDPNFNSAVKRAGTNKKISHIMFVFLNRFGCWDNFKKCH